MRACITKFTVSGWHRRLSSSNPNTRIVSLVWHGCILFKPTPLHPSLPSPARLVVTPDSQLLPATMLASLLVSSLEVVFGIWLWLLSLVWFRSPNGVDPQDDSIAANNADSPASVVASPSDPFPALVPAFADEAGYTDSPDFST